jgi:hypothetical protein
MNTTILFIAMFLLVRLNAQELLYFDPPQAATELGYHVWSKTCSSPNAGFHEWKWNYEIRYKGDVLFRARQCPSIASEVRFANPSTGFFTHYVLNEFESLGIAATTTNGVSPQQLFIGKRITTLGEDSVFYYTANGSNAFNVDTASDVQF